MPAAKNLYLLTSCMKAFGTNVTHLTVHWTKGDAAGTDLCAAALAAKPVLILIVVVIVTVIFFLNHFGV